MIRYLVTRHAHLDGVRLSKPGHWGNVPFPDDDAAEKHAAQDAQGAPVRLERRSYEGLPTPARFRESVLDG